MTNCKNCNEVLTGKFCSNCGQPVQTKRIDGHYIIHEIEHVLHFEKGILYTIKELLIRPGQSVRHFIAENRSRLVKPIIFIIVTSLIYTLTTHFFHIEEGYINYTGEKNPIVSLIFNWIQNHYGYANIIMGVFIAAWLKFFFKKHDYNFFEIMILLCFVMGMGMLMISIFAVAQGLSKVNIMQVGGLIYILYGTWAIGQFFGGNNTRAYMTAFLAYMLGMITFNLSAFGLGILIELLCS